MLKLWLFIGLSMALLSISTYAKTTTFTSNPYIDYNFTKDYLLEYKNDVFIIGNIKIKPLISVLNKETNLSSINKKIIIKDNKYQYEFGFNITNIVIDNLDYVSFDLPGLKKLDDISYTDGKIRIIFDDLMDKGSLTLLNDKVILYNPTSLSIDPIIELLPNATNKAFYSISMFDDNITRNFANATTEASATNYNNMNTSNNVYWSLSVFRVTLTQYRTKKFTFNLSSVGSPINSITYCYEGYHDYMEIGFEYLYWYNLTSKNWQLDQITNYGSDTTICKSFTTAQQINDFYNNTSKQVIIGTRFSGNWLLDTTSSNTDFLNLTIDYGTITDTCTYSSGSWLINCNDNCTLSTTNTVSGSMIIYGSNGFVNFQSNQFANSFYFNATNNCYWYYNNYRWLY